MREILLAGDTNRLVAERLGCPVALTIRVIDLYTSSPHLKHLKAMIATFSTEIDGENDCIRSPRLTFVRINDLAAPPEPAARPGEPAIASKGTPYALTRCIR